MCNPFAKPKQQAAQPVTVGEGATASTQIGGTGSAAVAQTKRVRSLLSAAGAAGDTTTASTLTAGLKPSLGA